MLHAEILARLKHPRPVLINGKHFESRSTPVHFMMTSNHKAPSIEIGRLVPEPRRSLSPYQQHHHIFGSRQDDWEMSPRSSYPYPPSMPVPMTNEPNEDEPHVMISLALEDDQMLDLNAWEQWLAGFPAIAKYVKVQGVFKSHSTLLLLSLPIMVWDLLPDDPACSFIAFIRSNNLLRESGATKSPPEHEIAAKNEEEENQAMDADTESLISEMTNNHPGDTQQIDAQARSYSQSGAFGTPLLPGPSLSSARNLSTASLSASPLVGDTDNVRGPFAWPSENVTDLIDQVPNLTQEAISHLEDCFLRDPRPSEAIIGLLSTTLNADPNTIRVCPYTYSLEFHLLT